MWWKEEKGLFWNESSRGRSYTPRLERSAELDEKRTSRQQHLLTSSKQPCIQSIRATEERGRVSNRMTNGQWLRTSGPLPSAYRFASSPASNQERNASPAPFTPCRPECFTVEQYRRLEFLRAMDRQVALQPYHSTLLHFVQPILQTLPNRRLSWHLDSSRGWKKSATFFRAECIEERALGRRKAYANEEFVICQQQPCQQLSN